MSALRPAASLILVRDGEHGLEVLLLERSAQAAFVAGAYVFPGGALDPEDAGAPAAALCHGVDDTAASSLLGMAGGGLAYWIAAIRECFEESGLLLACDRDGGWLDAGSVASAHGAAPLVLCRSRGWRLAADRLVYCAHWITPLQVPRRFDTRFFIAAAPPRQTVRHDGGETVSHVWIRPADALERNRRGELHLVMATTHILRALSAFGNSAAALSDARSRRAIPVRMARRAAGGDGARYLLPEDAAYAEIAKIDPAGDGNASDRITPGAVTRLSPRVRRLASANPHFMRGPGTNSYLLGAGAEIALIDPGPALPEHVDDLLREAGGRIRWILATHTHNDHSPAAALLRARCGAELLGMPAPAAEHQDASFVPDRVLAHGERLRIAGCTLRVIHTPGHASNHLCYLLEEERLLFTGDHVMQGSTVVINPPDGDMRAYLDSLSALLGEDIDWIAPGHGFLMDQPRAQFERLLAHRLARERLVFDTLAKLGAAALDQLLPQVYGDVPLERHAMARRSLLAHLLKLQDDGRALEQSGRWRTLPAPA